MSAGGTAVFAFGAAVAGPSMTTYRSSTAAIFSDCETAAPSAAAGHPLWLLQLPAMHQAWHHTLMACTT
jgi:hypothetical protein